MAWTKLLKNKDSRRRTQYSGTCRRCKKFTETGGFCKSEPPLPAEGETSAPPWCPMKVPKDTGDGA